MPEYTITRLGHLGDGIAQGPFYAPLTLPGERIEATPVGETLTDVRILEPSSDRVAASCSHFRRCGGCRLQHAADAFMSQWKCDIVATALRDHNVTAEVRPGATSPAQSRRRANFAARRTKKGALAGFHVRASNDITAIPNCTLLHPDLIAALPACEGLARLGASRKDTLDIFATTTLNGLDIKVTGGKPFDPVLGGELAALSREFDLARLCWGEEVVALRHPPEQSFDGIRVTPPPGAFMQPTQAGECALRSEVHQIVANSTSVLDLFAGCGTFALPLARQARIHAVESSATMLKALDEGWRMAQGLKAVTHEVRDLFRNPLIAEDLNRYQAIVIDPPRAGAVSQCQQIAQSTVPVIAYVSCNPLSFARDAKILTENGYEIGPVHVIDQFRWSAHAELVAGFYKKA